MSEKKKVRFTLVDAVALIVILAVAGFVGIKFLGIGSGAAGANDAKTFAVSYYFEEVPEFAAAVIKIDDLVSDEAKKHELGKVTAVEIGEAAVYCPDVVGTMHKSSKEGYCSVRLTTEVDALKGKNGIKVADTTYAIGHTMTLYAGDAKLYGRVAAIEEK